MVEAGAVTVSMLTSVMVERTVLYDTTVEVLAGCVMVEVIVLDWTIVDKTVLITVELEVTVETDITVVGVATHFELATIN